MATEVNQTYFAWSQGESTERDGPEGVSVSQTLDHGSISFGRFELESLSWEKWSVFTNDRRTEEFGKFNGLVAQKKAYFEEYYKKIRELKASQQQSQQTELMLEYSGDGSDSSQTAEDDQGADIETPTGSGVPLDDYVEEAPHETMSEHGLQYYNDQGNENFNAEFSTSGLSSSAEVLHQVDQDVRGPVCGDNPASKMDVGQQDASSGHDSTRTTFEAARTPRRTIEKDSRLRHTPKIIPKSIRNLSKSAMDYTASERPGSVKPSTIVNQKTKTVQRPNAALEKMTGTPERSKLTGLRRPSSAGAQRPSTGERRPIMTANSKTHADVSTPQRPSTSERRPVIRDHAQKQTNVTTPRRPSTSERRPVKRESAAKRADISSVHRPSTGERCAIITRDIVLKTDVKKPSKARPTVAHTKGEAATVANMKKAVTPNAARSSKLETKSNYNRPKDPSALDSHSTRSKRTELQVSGKQKSSSVNLPPRKIFSSSVGEPALETTSRTKKKEGIQATVQSRVSTSKRTATLQTGNLKTRVPNPPAPPPPPRRPSRMMSKPTLSTSSIGGRKPKASTPQWH
ncbi:hypothetical protein HU200_054956 [Digitaria exilis]|uniref:Uncharacterized protein n=1 Tax=Digitaria exilis TaxID=1010633 RepID=A0A835AGH4_9POAL|nr:hypothetical protein HU200_054956 [Digitaria exilis]